MYFSRHYKQIKYVFSFVVRQGSLQYVQTPQVSAEALQLLQRAGPRAAGHGQPRTLAQPRQPEQWTARQHEGV